MKVKKNIFLILVPLSVFGILPSLLFASVMQSGSYQIQSDSINIGGIDSSSENYNSQDTIGGVGTGRSSSASYALSAGYQQIANSSISITSPSDVSLSQISGAGSSSSGTASWTVTTTSAAGYSLSVSASTDPALKTSGSASFDDYAPQGSDPDFAFSVDADKSAFGFTVEGDDIATRFKDDGAACNVGSGDTASACWDGFSTTPATIASRSSANSPAGTATTLRFKAAVGASKSQTAGTYTATITVTALAL